jgi:predicted outer membrane repeat protein
VDARGIVGWVVAGATCFAAPPQAVAAGVVGTGTPESCTEAALDVALSGGGAVSFDCGSAQHTIVVTSVKDILSDTVIDGGGTITLGGANTTAFFRIDVGVVATIEGITLTRGFGTFGAIENSGILTINDARIEKCNATQGAAITNYDSLTVTATILAENEAVSRGAAIRNAVGTVYVRGSTLTDNSTPGTEPMEAGGAIFNGALGTLTVTDSTFTDNISVAGGAIASEGSLTVENATFEGNRTRYTNPLGLPERDGGAIRVSGTAVITDSTFDGNEAPQGNGGAIYVAGSTAVVIERSTFTQNEAISGGGIGNDGATTVSESTFFANSGGGAAIFNSIRSTGGPDSITLVNTTVSGNTPNVNGTIAAAGGLVTLRFVTVAGNIATGGGSGGLAEGAFGTFKIGNSVLADNSVSNCAGFKPVGQSLGFNISSDESCRFTGLNDVSSVDPLLGPLADNGGPTLTRLPGPLSPAIDEAQCPVDVPIDQRGVARPQGTACDRGAVERTPTDATTTTTTTNTTSTTSTTSTTDTTTTTAPASTSTTTLGSTTTTTLAGGGTCGDPVALVASRAASASADAVTASDALAVLNAAVGLFACELCVCDVDDSGAISATDALSVLHAAVGLGTDLNCPACT